MSRVPRRVVIMRSQEAGPEGLDPVRSARAREITVQYREDFPRAWASYNTYDTPVSLICSERHFWYLNKTAEYNFEADRWAEAQAYCKGVFSAALSLDIPLIVVDNANVWAKDYEWYVDAATIDCYEVYQDKTAEGVTALRGEALPAWEEACK